MQSVVGRTRTSSDRMDPDRPRALHAALGYDGPPPDIGDLLPTFWHHLHFWEAATANELGDDGHVKPGAFIPDFGLPQRMWAGGRLKIHQPLVLGRPAHRKSTVESIKERNGKSGQLVFVTLRHEIDQGDGLSLLEHQELVYRDQVGSANPRQAGETADDMHTVAFDEVLLFRYSALTFNGHRIHYDADYCRNIAKYPGLVVQGALLASILARYAETKIGRLSKFEYHAVAPTFAGERVCVCLKRSTDSLQVWIQDKGGNLRIKSSAKA